jgi:phage shock protein PspC (stress-responsive transcriptional regulator)
MRRLQRNLRHRWLGGVCSGFARFLGLDIFPVRLLIRFLFVSFVPMFWWVYLILWAVLPAQKLYEAEEMQEQPRPKPVYKPQVRVEVTRLDVDNVVEMVRGKVSERVFERVKSIDTAIRALMPSLTFWRTLTQPELRTVKTAAVEYFPQALQHYLSLPRDYAENHTMASGMTPEEKLLGELETLETTLNNVLESSYNHEKINVPSELKRLNERMGVREAQNPDRDISRSLDMLVNRIQGKVPEEILAKVTSIRDAIASVLPQISEMGGGMTKEVYNLRQTALEYLPDALDKYLSLPSGFAEHHILSNGKTAKQTLLEQLDLLDQTVKDMVGDVYQEDADALLVHGRFLQEKFAGQKFSLPAGAPEGLKFPDLNLDAPEPEAEQQPEGLRLKR